VTSDAQTAYALALEFDLLEPEQRGRAQRRLTEIVRENGFRIGTGFVGCRAIGDALTKAGEVDAAYHMLMRTDNPSWLYAVAMGATTIWERWDSMLPDGRLNPGDMLSFNHYALGAVGDWLHRTVAGLAPAEAGYRRILVAPKPGGGLSYARAIHETPFGRAKVAWHRAEGKLVVFVDVPPGSTALVHLPGPDWQDVEAVAGSHRFECLFRDPADDPAQPASEQTLGLPPETTSGVFGD
jgi:alpha-L-rhamnosidase